MLATVTLPSIPWLGCAPCATRQRLCPDQAERLCQHAQQLHSLVLEHGSDSLTRAMAAPVRQTYSTQRSRGRRVTSNRRQMPVNRSPTDLFPLGDPLAVTR